jgi:hypothetical protein
MTMGSADAGNCVNFPGKNTPRRVLKATVMPKFRRSGSFVATPSTQLYVSVRGPVRADGDLKPARPLHSHS